MVEITLPDGAKRQYDGPTTGMDVALSISPGLAKKALAVTVDGQLSSAQRAELARQQLELLRAEALSLGVLERR